MIQKIINIAIKSLVMLVMAVVITACGQTVNESVNPFVTVENGHFVKDGKPYYYVGTNFWYGAILGSEGQGGDRERLAKELDLLKSQGIDNLRILVGSDGEPTRIRRLSMPCDFSRASTTCVSSWVQMVNVV